MNPEPTSTEPTTDDTTDLATPDPATEPGDEGTTEGRNSEAARRRVQLREVAAERDALRGQVAALQRAEVERFALDLLVEPGDVWRDGLDLAEVLDESGAVDPALVDSAITAVIDRHAHWAAPRTMDTRRHPMRLHTTVVDMNSRDLASWTDVIRG